MRVCHVTSLHSPLDPRVFHRECLSLARAGHDVTVIAPDQTAEASVDGVHIIPVRPAKSRRDRVRVWRDILRQLSRLRAELVHFHDPELLAIASRFRPARIVYDCHEYVAESLLTRPWIPGPLRKPSAWLAERLEPTLARQADAVVIASAGQADRFTRANRSPTLLQNFPLAGAVPPERPPEGNTLIHVGAHAEARGSREMVEAMPHVRREVPAARLLLVGPFNHRPYEGVIRKLIVDLNLDNAIQVVGPVPYSEVSTWMARANVGLIPLRSTIQYEHALPSKLFDYMMAGLPVVATDLAATRKYVTQAQCGLLTEPGDAQSLAKAIVRMLTEPEMKAAMADRAWNAYQTKFNWSCEEPKLLRLYKTLSGS